VTQKGYFVYRPTSCSRSARSGVVGARLRDVGRVKKVLDTGMIDAKKVGLVGHSWGGYETTFIATQTDRFAAAVAGGTADELASSYGRSIWKQRGPETNHAEVGQDGWRALYEIRRLTSATRTVYFANKLKPHCC